MKNKKWFSWWALILLTILFWPLGVIYLIICHGNKKI